MTPRQMGLPLSMPSDAAPGSDSTVPIDIITLTSYAKDVLEGGFPPIWVRGEVTGFTAHRNGHWYFTLRDRMAQVRAVMWSRDAQRLPAAPDEGMQITAFGSVSVYPQRGEMQFVVKRMEAEGDGLWRKKMEQTRLKLEAEGLLAPERKRALPRYPKVVAVVTSPDGAALHDIVAVIRRRAPAVGIVIVPAAVQGDTAVRELCAALDRVSRWKGADVVIFGRGGGSREDLQAFNDERVARAVARCAIPVVSAVGHEVDVTICDMVADLRAATPSAAAETVVRDHSELSSHVRAMGQRLSRSLRRRADRSKSDVRRLGAALKTRVQFLTQERKAWLAELGAQLNALSPLATLKRGYAVARAEDGGALTNVGAFHAGMKFRLALRDGEIAAQVSDIRKGA
jgi:exodeoxyribonuclease VII large subunit